MKSLHLVAGAFLAGLLAGRLPGRSATIAVTMSTFDGHSSQDVTCAFSIRDLSDSQAVGRYTATNHKSCEYGYLDSVQVSWHAWMHDSRMPQCKDTLSLDSLPLGYGETSVAARNREWRRVLCQ